MTMSIRLASLCLAFALASACEDGPNTNAGSVSARPGDARSGRVGVADAPASNNSESSSQAREPQLTDSVAGSGAAGSGFDAGLPPSSFGGAGAAGGLPGGFGSAGSGAVGGSGPFAGFGG